MTLFQKIIGFVVVFSTGFYLLRTGEFYNQKVLLADLGGIPWLYSAIGMIFSVLAAFVIQKEWEKWNSLLSSVKAEVGSLEELWFWSLHFSEGLRLKFRNTIVAYLEVVIQEDWRKSEQKGRSQEVEEAILALHNAVYEMFENNKDLFPSTFSIFSDIIRHRADRLYYASQQMPSILRHTLIFGAGLVVFLSFLVGIKSVALDYVFTVSIATLAFTVFMVIDDLEHPLRPGGWHLTKKDYQNLLKRING